MDIFDSQKRSDVMRHVKSSGSRSTEGRMIALFKSYGIKGWQRNYKKFGQPDFVFRKQKVAVFLDGCFWHGHDCRNTQPKQNEDFWKKKHAKNKARDAEVTEHLEKLGWTVIRIWECELKKKNEDIVLDKISMLLPE